MVAILFFNKYVIMNEIDDLIRCYMEKYAVTINYKTIEFDNYNEAFDYAKNEILNHMMKETQSFYDLIPFSLRSFISSLYDDLIITNDEIVIFKKVELIINHLFEYNDNIINFIKNDISYKSNDGECEINVIRNYDELTLYIRVGEDIFHTNMFNIRKNRYYYFDSLQKVVIKSKTENRNLGDILQFKVELKNCNCKENEKS